jgi:hypothetical protein
MSNAIIKFESEIQTVESLNEFINETLSKYPDTSKVSLKWELPKENEKGVAELMTLTQLVKRSQDGRGLSNEGKDAKGVRKLEFDSVKAVFVIERINDRIEALLRFLGYQPRFVGSSKTGVASMQFVPPLKAESDAVGKRAKSLASESRAVKAQDALSLIYGKEAVRQYVSGEITAEELQAMPARTSVIKLTE